MKYPTVLSLNEQGPSPGKPLDCIPGGRRRKCGMQELERCSARQEPRPPKRAKGTVEMRDAAAGEMFGSAGASPSQAGTLLLLNTEH